MVKSAAVLQNAKIKKYGFTLLEMLVVIFVIIMVAVGILISISDTRAKARDTRRRADLRQVATALALYFNENSAYPFTGLNRVWLGTCSGYESKGQSGADGWVPDLAPTYMPALPVDPKPIEPYGCYLYTSNGVDYKLLAYATVESRVLSSDEMYSAGRPHTYSINTPGAADW